MLRYSEVLEVGGILDDIVGDVSAVQPSGATVAGSTETSAESRNMLTSPNIQEELEQEV